MPLVRVISLYQLSALIKIACVRNGEALILAVIFKAGYLGGEGVAGIALLFSADL